MLLCFLLGVGFGPEDCSRYIDIAGKIARNAVTKHNGKQEQQPTAEETGCSGFVLGSMGPLVESYRADMIKPHDEGVQHYKLACQSLYPHVDAFLAETMSCIEESIQVMDAVKEIQQQNQPSDDKTKPLLISYTLDSNGNFRDGQSVIDGLNQLLNVYSKASKRRKVECE